MEYLNKALWLAIAVLMLQPIQVSERELEEFIVENSDAIEEGFRILSRQAD